jgi:hypothetical protein
LVLGKLLYAFCEHADIHHKVPMIGCGSKRSGTNTKMTCSSWHVRLGMSLCACLHHHIAIDTQQIGSGVSSNINHHASAMISCLQNVIKIGFFLFHTHMYLDDPSELRIVNFLFFLLIWYTNISRWSIIFASLVLTPGFSWVDGHAKVKI